MFKWIGRLLYIFFILFLTVLVYSMAYFSKLQAYYDEFVRDNINDDIAVLDGLNTLLQLEYYRTSPVLYEFVQDEGDYQLKVSIYAVSTSKDTIRYDGMVILVNQVDITHNNEKLIDPIIKITVELDRETLRVENQFTNQGSVIFDPSQPFAVYNLPTLFLFDAEFYLKDMANDNTYANIESISVFFSDGSVDDKNHYAFELQPMFMASVSEISELVYGDNKDTFPGIDHSIYRLRNVFSGNYPTQLELTENDLVADRASLSAYNGIVWRTMSVYMLSIATVTYFLFFHKKIRALKALKKEKDLIDAIDKSEVIFKD
jgi:hypothetical protein